MFTDLLTTSIIFLLSGESGQKVLMVVLLLVQEEYEAEEDSTDLRGIYMKTDVCWGKTDKILINFIIRYKSSGDSIEKHSI